MSATLSFDRGNQGLSKGKRGKWRDILGRARHVLVSALMAGSKVQSEIGGPA